MRAKPKNEPLADRRRLLPQTSGARQAPRYATDPQNDATALKTKSKPQFDSLRGGLQIEAAPTPAKPRSDGVPKEVEGGLLLLKRGREAGRAPVRSGATRGNLGRPTMRRVGRLGEAAA